MSQARGLGGEVPVTIRAKILTIVGLTAICLMAIVVASSEVILKRDANRREFENTRQSVVRANHALTSELSVLDATTADYATWDDTVAFVEDGNDSYTRSNFLGDTFARLRLSFVVIVDRAGQKVFGKGYDLAGGAEAPLPASLGKHLLRGSPLLRGDDKDEPHAGILVLPEGLFLVAARPILTSRYEGPARGTAIMGRAFDRREADILSEVTQTRIAGHALDEPRFQTGFTLTDFHRAGVTATLIRALDEDTMTGCALVKDIHGRPGMILQVTNDRQFYKQNRAAVRYFLYATLAVGLTLGLLAMLLLDAMAVSPITRLASFVKTIRLDGDLARRAPVKGCDEVSALATSLNGMMEELQRDIASRDGTEKALRESEEKYRSLFTEMQNAFAIVEVIHDTDGKAVDYRWLEVNPACEKITGQSREQLVGNLASKVMPGFDRWWVERYDEVLRTGMPVHFERYSKVFGKHLVLSAYRHNRDRQVAVVFSDVTERARMEQVLRESEQRYRSLFSEMTAGFALCEVICEAQGAPATYRLLDVNPAYEEIFGQRREDVLCKTIHQVLPTVDASWVRMHGEVALTGRGVHFQKYFPALDKYLQGSAYCPERGKCAVTFTDVTEAVRAQEALTKERNLLRTLIDLLPDCIYAIDADGRIVLTNPADTATIGVKSACEVLGKTILELMPGEMGRQLWDTEQVVLTTGKPITNVEEHMIGVDGVARWVLTSKVPLRDEHGRTMGLVGVSRDITESKRAGEALRKSEERYRALAENSSDVIERFDRDARHLYANPAVKTVTGFANDAVVSKTHRELGLPSDTASWWEQNVRSVFESGGFYEAQQEIFVSQRRLTFDWRLVPELDENGRVVSVLATGRDVTESKNLEQQLLQAQKMEAVGQLAGGIAHDFNNLLTGILGYANMLKLESDPRSDVHKAADTIEKAAERAAQLTKQLLGFARRGKLLRVPININNVTQEVISLLGRTIDKNISIIRHLSTVPPWVTGDPGQLQQAVLNLAVNARDAMPDGGEVSFETKIVDLDQEYCRNHSEAVPGRFVRVSVADTGCGIPKDIQQRIFEPFFTTKGTDKGTGMGLAMVYGIVRNHGGFVRVYSELGQGSRFDVYLPLSVVDAPSDAGPQPLKGAGRILLVDDEEVIRNVAASMLRNLGYDVVPASGADEAIEYYSRHGDSIDLAVLDMVMPKSGGRECFHALKKINPSVRAILSTGYGLNGKAQELVDEGMKGFVQKPYTLRDLSTAVANALKSK